MKYVVILVFVIALFAGCSASSKNKKVDKPIVSVSILPQKYFVQQIAGDFFDINVILPPGSVPEDYEPTPRQIADMANSKAYFYVGHLGFEKAWLKKLSESAKEVDFISCSKGIDLLRSDGHDHSHEDDGNPNYGTDPHIWTSPENVKKISRTIYSELVAKYPDQKPMFEANLHNFISRIDTLDNSIRYCFGDSITRSFMVFHPSLGYFARDYHLNQYSIEYEGKSPSPAHMKKMVDIASKENIKTIFIQSQFETEKAEAIAKEIGAQIEPIDPLSENWLNEMYVISMKLKKALTPGCIGNTNKN